MILQSTRLHHYIISLQSIVISTALKRMRTMLHVFLIVFRFGRTGVEGQ